MKNVGSGGGKDEQTLLFTEDTSDESGDRHGGYGVATAVVFNVASIAGTGVLVLPNALAKTGWSGLAVLVSFAIIQMYTGILLARCWIILQERFERYRQQTRYPYAAIGYEAFGNIGRVIVTVTINVSLIGICVAFLIIISENVTVLLNIHNFNNCVMMAIVALLLCPLSWLGTPKDFWQVALCGAVTTGISCLLLLIAVLREIPDNDHSVVLHNMPSFIHYFGGVGVMIVAFNGHPAFPTIQHDMKNPRKFPKSLIITLIVVGFYFIPLSTISYYIHGDELAQKENLFDVIPIGADRTIALILITLHVVSGFIIFGNPLFQEIEEIIGVRKDFSLQRIAVRTSLVICMWFVAATIPSFASILSLMGGTTLMAIAVFYPILCYWKLRNTESATKLWETIQLSKLDRTFLVVIIILAAFISISTTYSNVSTYGQGIKLNFTRPCYLPAFPT